MQYVPFVVVAWILAVGLYGVVTSRHLIHQIICLIVVDPVVQALALTDVVVEAAVTALLLSFAIQAHKRFGTLDPQELASLKG
jgi:multicomponent Na+:H+ antiporter subunit C